MSETLKFYLYVFHFLTCLILPLEAALEIYFVMKAVFHSVPFKAIFGQGVKR